MPFLCCHGVLSELSLGCHGYGSIMPKPLCREDVLMLCPKDLLCRWNHKGKLAGSRTTVSVSCSYYLHAIWSPVGIQKMQVVFLPVASWVADSYSGSEWQPVSSTSSSTSSILFHPLFFSSVLFCWFVFVFSLFRSLHSPLLSSSFILLSYTFPPIVNPWPLSTTVACSAVLCTGLDPWDIYRELVTHSSL